MTERLAILIPVWHNYQWLASFAAAQINAHWADHPPVRFCGMTPGEANGLPLLPLKTGANRSNWTEILLDGVLQLKEQGFTACYVIAEEHLPLGPCHEQHLNETLPAMLRELPAVYISLMGWDNRRFVTRCPILSATKYRLKHLSVEQAPRFHLHPALWKIDVLEACCRLALEDVSKNGSAWHFEKVNDKAANPLPTEWKQQCYQINALAMSSVPSSFLRRLKSSVEQFVYHKLMAVYPWLTNRRIADRYAKLIKFDDFFCDGPYPMFFSGVMAKGSLNPYWKKFMLRSVSGRILLENILESQSMAKGRGSN